MGSCHSQLGIFSLFFWVLLSLLDVYLKDGVPYCIQVNLSHSSAEFRSGNRSSVLNI